MTLASDDSPRVEKRRPQSTGAQVLVAVGFLLHLAVGVLVLVSGLIMPLVAVVSLAIVWVVAIGVAIRWRRKPAVVLLVPFVTFAIWLTTAWIGDTFLGWTA